MNRYAFTFLMTLAYFFCFGQEMKFLVSFKDKHIPTNQTYLSKKALERRERQGIRLDASDYPVNCHYVQEVEHIAAKSLVTSKWLNGIVVQGKFELEDAFKKLPFVASVQTIGSSTIFNRSIKQERNGLLGFLTQQNYDYGTSAYQLQSIGADKMLEMGLNGKGRYIAIFDGGFRNANELSALSHVYHQNRMKFTFNVVDNKTQVYERHLHGTSVFSILAAYSPGNLIGTAHGADFALFISEDVNGERLIEEYYWLRAAEMADSIGVDIISSSLGYYSYDDESENHTYDQLNGKTAVITKAAQMAARKGILVVNSAGNNYTDASWRNIVFPADADSVLAVGALDANGQKASFSAVGPTYDGRLKPDISAFGVGVTITNTENIFDRANGTSYSAPLVAGMAAGLWQTDTTLTNIDIIRLLVKTSDRASNPSNQVGNGTPNFSRAYEYSSTGIIQRAYLSPIGLFPNPIKEYITVTLEDKYLVNQDASYQLTDVNGKEMLAGKVNGVSAGVFRLEASSLPSGIYFLKIDGLTYKLTKL